VAKFSALASFAKWRIWPDAMKPAAARQHLLDLDAERHQRARERRKAGMMFVPLYIHGDTVDKLVHAGLMPAIDDDDRAKIGAVINALVQSLPADVLHDAAVSLNRASSANEKRTCPGDELPLPRRPHRET
jgi:hypothetical protein